MQQRVRPRSSSRAIFLAATRHSSALGAFLGHLYPVWLGFKGGKGVAVSLGILLSLYWPAGLLAAATWVAVVAIFRISSLSALVAAAMAPLYLFVFHREHEAILALMLAILILVTHSENIGRLLRGQEPRIGAKNAAQ